MRVREGWASLVEETALRYAACGTWHREFVRGKLRYDPMYASLLALLADRPQAVVADLGCGRGIALALLDTARRRQTGGSVERPELFGVDLSPEGVRVARIALGPGARIDEGRLQDSPGFPADVVLLLDVLQYLPADEQERVLARTTQALPPGGQLVLREPNRGGGARFWITLAAERLRALGRGAWRQRYHYRSSGEWRSLLESLGLTVSMSPASEGTPFGNVLFVADRTALSEPRGLLRR